MEKLNLRRIFESADTVHGEYQPSRYQNRQKLMISRKGLGLSYSPKKKLFDCVIYDAIYDKDSINKLRSFADASLARVYARLYARLARFYFTVTSRFREFQMKFSDFYSPVLYIVRKGLILTLNFT